MTPSVSLPTRRLDVLEGYLREDPHNPALLADTCDEAIAAGAHDRALACLQRAAALKLDPFAWAARQARLHMARHEWPEALEVLQGLVATAGPHPALAHDIAYVRFRSGDRAGARETLAPWLDSGRDRFDPAIRAALHALWLRVLHHDRRFAEARTWIASQMAQGALAPAAAGVASLIAFDCDDLLQARSLSQAALDAGAAVPEAWVARACVALAEQDTPLAVQHLHAALRSNPDDGRTWSALGVASLQAQDFVAARSQFARATASIPEHVGTWHGLGWSCLLLGDRAAALVAFQRALALDRNFAESQGAVGLVLLLSGRNEEAEEPLRRAERLDPRNLTASYARAVQSGRARDARSVRDLASSLLDKPGFFGGRLRDALDVSPH